MQSASSRIWSRLTVSISYDDNHYTTGTSLLIIKFHTKIGFTNVNHHTDRLCFFKLHASILCDVTAAEHLNIINAKQQVKIQRLPSHNHNDWARFCLLCSKLESVGDCMQWKYHHDLISCSSNSKCCVAWNSCRRIHCKDFGLFGCQSEDEFVSTLMKN